MNYPKKWTDVTLKQLQEISTAEKMLEGLELSLKKVSIITGIEQTTLEHLTLQDFNKTIEGMEFLNELPNGDPFKEVTILGTEYELVHDVAKWEAGQFIDLSKLVEKPDEIVSNLHIILALFYIPKGEKYNSDTTMERAEYFQEHFRVEAAWRAANFFYMLWMGFSEIILHYSDMITKDKDWRVEAMEAGYPVIGAGLS